MLEHEGGRLFVDLEHGRRGLFSAQAMARAFYDEKRNSFADLAGLFQKEL